MFLVDAVVKAVAVERILRGLRGVGRPVLAGSGLAVLLLLGLVMKSPRAIAQAGVTGTVVGKVVDQQGLVIENASLTLSSSNQGHALTAKTNRDGEFVFNSVPAATYTLTIKAPTFATYILEQLVVDVNRNATANVILVADSTTADVTVTADGSGVDTNSATMAFTIDQKLVEDLPIDGNNAVELAALLPGVTDVVASPTFTNDNSGPTYNISGSRSNQNLLLLDGAIWNNLFNNTGINFPPTQGLAEVTILTNGFKAQYGRNVGSVFNVLTKSGGNSYHGVLYEIVQNSAFNTTDYFTHLDQHLVSNQFGGTLSGPIVRNKLFFSMSYQDYRVSSTVVADDQTMSQAERGFNPDGTPHPCTTTAYAGQRCANFNAVLGGSNLTNPFANYVAGSGCTGAATSNAYLNCTSGVSAVNAGWTQAGNAGASPCPTLLGTAATLPNNELPSVCFNAVSVTLLKYQPLPLTPNGVLPVAVSTAKQPRNDQNGLIRADYNMKRHTLDARYYETAANDLTANGVSNGLGIANYDINLNTAQIHFGGIGDTWVVRSNLLNVLRADYKRYGYQVAPTDHTTLTDLGANFTQPGDNSLPSISFQGRNITLGSTNNNNISVDEGIEVDESLSWTKGKHNVQAGAEFLRLQYLNRHSNEPSFSFGTNYTGNSSSDYLLGLLATSQVQNATNQAAIQHDLYFYLQDDWRISPRLTLNLGIRYELPFQWYQPDGQAATFIPGYQSAIFPTAPQGLAFVGDQGVERSLVGTTFHDAAPRFGFSYDVFGNGRTAIRGGMGVFYDAINALVVGLSSPFHYVNNLVENPGGISVPLLNEPAVPPNFVKGQKPPFVAPYGITFPDKNFGSPYTMSINFGFQQRVTKTSTLDVNYVGHLSRHLAMGMSLNPAVFDCSGSFYQINPALYCTGANASTTSYQQRALYPNFSTGSVTDYMTIGTANYNALQAVYIVRANKQLTLTASYTYSKSMDESSNQNTANSSDTPYAYSHYAPSDFDTRHILNLGWVLRFPEIHGYDRAVRAVLNGWSFNGIYNARTGHPFSLVSDADTTLRDEYTEYLSVSPITGGYHPLASNRHRSAKIAEWFNIADTVVPETCAAPGCGPQGIYTFPKGSFGNIQRNSFREPGYILPTFAVQRIFSLEHGRTFQFRVDAINAFNTPNLGNVFNSLSQGVSKNNSFGEILSDTSQNGVAVTGGRRLQLSGTLRF